VRWRGLAVTEQLLSRDLMRRLDRLLVLGRRAHPGIMSGERRSPRRGRSVEFADFRQYSPGDDFRQVDWNAYARLERFFLRLFVAEEDTTVHLLIDTSKSMAWGEPKKLDFAKRVAAAIGYVALGSLDHVAVSAAANAAAEGARGSLGSRPRVFRGRQALPRMFDQLAALTAGGGTDLTASVRRHLAAVRQPGPLIVLSDLYDLSWRRAFRAAIGARCDLTVVHVLSREELDPTLEGDYRLIDDETGEGVEISADGDAIALYRQQLSSWQGEIGGWCRSRDVLYVPVATDFPLDDFVLEVLRRARVLA